jgi:2,5-diamino-6-(ribosylamino)-4(3H)-pyrimidinone 5'-phosphate reductase
MHVHVNAATSADGKLSTRRREQVHISGEEDFARVDRLRAEHDAVAVGVGTVLADDPSLVRFDSERRAAVGKSGVPARVVADSRARTPPDAAILAGGAPTYVLVSERAPRERRERLEAAGAALVVAGEERVGLDGAFAALADDGIAEVMVEGGGELIYSLFAAGLVDELTVFVGPVVVGGRDAPTLADGEGFVDPAAFPALNLVGVERLGEGVVLRWQA